MRVIFTRNALQPAWGPLHRPVRRSSKALARALTLLAALLLAACASPPPAPPTPPGALPKPPLVEGSGPLPPSISQPKSIWRAVRWAELPGWGQDNLAGAWGAWLQSCARPQPAWAALCPELRRLAAASAEQQTAWMQQHLQPYRVQALAGNEAGLLTAYYEPLLDATRQPTARSAVALYRPPPALLQATKAGKPWFTRKELATSAQGQLRGYEIAYLSDPIDALSLHIQGSGKLRITEADGSQKLVRLAFAATNEQPYKSVGSWLLAQGATKDASWPGIKAWLAQNPGRTNELLWSNPRYVFFKEEALPAGSTAGPKGAELGPRGAEPGPRGAQGVPLTAGRSIAVDPQSIPYGTPVWLSTPGPTAAMQKLVLAQDTGSAITGAVRADYYVGSGAEAGELAGRLKQPLQLWVLWPK